MNNIKEFLNNNTLLFDGGMGTYFSEKSHKAGGGCELANLSEPKLVEEIHKEYLAAGARAIKTNTFGVNRLAFQGDEELVERTIKAGWEIAGKAAAEYAKASGASLDNYPFVFADIGPGPMGALADNEHAAEEYCYIVDLFIKLGAKNFLFETHGNMDGLHESAQYIKDRVPDAYIINSFAISPDGFSRDGIFVTELLEEVMADENIDAFGMNCSCGARHMRELMDYVDTDRVTLSLMPNAGYPVVINNRTFYEGNPEYFGEQAAALVKNGAAIVGGCCGTSPEHIAKVKAYLDGDLGVLGEEDKRAEKKAFEADLTETRFWKKLAAGEKVIAVELDPPSSINMEKFMSGSWELKGAGVDIITIADCPIARARMDASLLACKLKRELNIDVMPHMTCRDRNLNATKALLMGIYAEGIRNVLLITGDPIPSADRDEVKSVYQFNSRKLAGFVSALGKKELPSPFHLFGALNVNALNFDVQLKIAKEKEEKGMIGFLTQPVLTHQAFENLKRAKKELKGYIIGGIMPIVSERNARFMDSEINGINVDPELIEMYAGKSRSESESLAIEISSEIVGRIAPYVDGYYFMTPFGRTGLIANIIKNTLDK